MCITEDQQTCYFCEILDLFSKSNCRWFKLIDSTFIGCKHDNQRFCLQPPTWATTGPAIIKGHAWWGESQNFTSPQQVPLVHYHNYRKAEVCAACKVPPVLVGFLSPSMSHVLMWIRICTPASIQLQHTFQHNIPVVHVSTTPHTDLSGLVLFWNSVLFG